MSIRYTLRHNIPRTKVDAEDANDSSTWDLNLLRKHELAETDDFRIVYRQRDGKIVDFAQAATRQADEIKNDCIEIRDDMTAMFNRFQTQLDGLIEEARGQQEQTVNLIEQVEGMIDLQGITNTEIETIVGVSNG